MSATARARVERHDGGSYVWFWCEGCETHHAIDPTKWTFNGDVDRPTFSPSVLVRHTKLTREGEAMIERGDRPPDGSDRYPSVDYVCHSFVTEGRIQYLGDSTHALAGQTIDLAPIAESMGDEA